MSALVTSVLAAVRQACIQTLQASPNFATIPIIPYVVGEVGSELSRKILGGTTLCVVVKQPTATLGFANTPKPYFKNVTIEAMVIEQVNINQFSGAINITGDAVAEFICIAWQINSPLGNASVLYPGEPTIGDPDNVPGWPGDWIGTPVRFKYATGLSYTPAQIDPLTISQSGSTITISSPTVSSVPLPGAAVFYTLGTGLVPSPQVGTFYSGPFTATTGQKILALPWLSSYLNPSTASRIAT